MLDYSTVEDIPKRRLHEYVDDRRLEIDGVGDATHRCSFGAAGVDPRDEVRAPEPADA